MNLHLLIVHPQTCFFYGIHLFLTYWRCIHILVRNTQIWFRNTQTHFPYSMGLLFIIESDSWFLGHMMVGTIWSFLPVSPVFLCCCAMHSFLDEDTNRGKNLVFSYHFLDSWVPSQFEASRILGYEVHKPTICLVLLRRHQSNAPNMFQFHSASSEASFHFHFQTHNYLRS